MDVGGGSYEERIAADVAAEVSDRSALIADIGVVELHVREDQEIPGVGPSVLPQDAIPDDPAIHDNPPCSRAALQRRAIPRYRYVH